MLHLNTQDFGDSGFNNCQLQLCKNFFKRPEHEMFFQNKSFVLATVTVWIIFRKRTGTDPCNDLTFWYVGRWGCS